MGEARPMRTYHVFCRGCDFRRKFCYSDNARASAAAHAEACGRDTVVRWWARYRYRDWICCPRAPIANRLVRE
jgi:organic radical activating enzyme